MLGIAFGREVDYQSCGFHTGQDWFAPSGTPVYAIQAGTVVYRGPLWVSGPGVGRGDHALIIQHEGYVTTYSHNKIAMVEVGDEVERGQVIARIGREGYAGGPHLHLEKVRGSFSGDWEKPFHGCGVYLDPGDEWGHF